MTPLSETAAGREQGWPVTRNKTIAQLKVELAEGAFSGERWEQQGLRLVAQGRILRDNETVGDVVGPVSTIEAELMIVERGQSGAQASPSR